MELITVLINIAGFKITETIHYKDGFPNNTEYHIRTGTGNIVSRAFSNPDEPSKLLADIRDRMA